MKKLYVLFLLTVLLSIDATAQTIRYVKTGGTGAGTSWANASGDLQGMINSSASGDQIWVAAGVYYPTQNIGASTNNRDLAFILRTGVKVYGGYNSTTGVRDYVNNLSVLSGDLGTLNIKTDNAYHVVTAVIATTGTEKAVLDGFTIRDGYANETGVVIPTGGTDMAQNQGAAINLRGVASSNKLELRNLIIIDNEATNHGGAVYAHVSGGTGELLFDNVRFQNNISGGSGGAVYVLKGTDNPIVKFVNSTFLGNKATVASQGGGAIYSNSTSVINITGGSFEANESVTGAALYSAGSVNISGTSFLQNKSTGSGSAIYLIHSGLTSSIDKTTFLTNTSTGNYGAIYFSSGTVTTSVTGVLNLSNSIFRGNTTTGSGGALMIQSGTVNAYNNVFANNQANGSGGGAMYIGATSGLLAKAIFTNNTFFSNNAVGTSGIGGAISYFNNVTTSALELYNNIFNGNTAIASGDDTRPSLLSTGIYRNNLFQLSRTNNGTNIAANIFEPAPATLFASSNPTSATFLKLIEGSIALDKGDNASLTLSSNNTITTDLAGINRIANQTVDLGAYEFSVVAAVEVYLDENTPNGTFVVKANSTLPGALSNWSIETGNTGNAFVIDANTGNITVANSTALDYEKTTTFTLGIKVSNNLGEEQGMRVVVFLNNLMEDPSIPTILNSSNGALNSFRPKITGIAEPLSTIQIYVDDELYPITTFSNANGDWSFHFAEGLTPGIHVFHVVAINNMGMSNPSPKVSVELRLYGGVVLPNNILTPNGDGKNDFWIITDLQSMYPKNEVIVYDKAGKVVFSQSNYQNDWDGTYNGAPLNTGTYYYQINIGAGLKPVKGTLTILRGR
ncbi:putative outer membrane protein pmp19 precursor [compost metagenome]